MAALNLSRSRLRIVQHGHAQSFALGVRGRWCGETLAEVLKREGQCRVYPHGEVVDLELGSGGRHRREHGEGERWNCDAGKEEEEDTGRAVNDGRQD